ncbi:MAG: hypothetical protein ACK4UQ_06620 [Brevundimonas sp.]
MAIEVIGPDGTIWEFDENTPPNVIQRTIQRHYGTTDEAKRAGVTAQAWSEVMAGVPRERSAFRRWADNLSDTVNDSFVGTGWRAGADDTADYIELAKAGKHKEATELSAGFEWNPIRLVSRIAHSGWIISDQWSGRDDLREWSNDMIEREVTRSQAFDRASAEDPWYRKEGLGAKILHGGAALTGVFSGAAFDPTSYISGGTSIAARMGVTAVAAGVGDLLAQDSGVDAGTQEEFSWERTALSAAAGAGFQGVFEGVGRMIRKPGAVIPDRPAAEIKSELDAADLLDEIPLTQIDFKPAAAVAEANPPARLTAPDGPDPRADAPDGEPEGGRQLELFDQPNSQRAEPESDPWADVDWADTASPARREAAVKHWEKLRAFIKPEMHQTFARWLAGETIETSGNHWNKNVFDFDTLRADPDKFEELADAMSAVYRPLYDEAGDATKTWASVKARQEQFGIRMSDAIKAHADITSDNGVASKLHALETIARQQTDELASLITATKAQIRQGDYSQVHKLAMAVETTTMFDAMAAGAKSEAGRALNIIKAQKKRSVLFNDLKSQFDSLNEALNGNIDPDKMGDVLDGLDKAYRKKGAKGLADELRKAKRMGLADYASYYVVVGLLTTPATFIRNVLGSTMNAGWSVADRYVAAAFGKARTLLPNSGGSIERVTFREANAYVAGVQHAFGDALAMSFRAFKEARPITDGRSSIQLDNQSFVPFAINDTRKAMWKQRGLLAVPDMLAAGTFSTIRTLGLRPSIASDEFAKVLTRRMQLGALAHREAAYRTARLADEVDASKVYKRTVDAIMNEPSAEAFTRAEQLFADRGLVEGGQQVHADDVLEQAALTIRSMDIRQMTNDFAREMAFQKIGPKMTKMEQAIGQWPIIKALYVPFFRTPVALLRTGMFDHNPAMAMLLKDNRQKFAHLIAAQREMDGALQRGGADADLVLAKMTTGAGLMAVAYGLWNQGLLTGHLSKAEREDGKMPYSIKIGDTWHAFNTLSPVAEPLGFVADIAQAFREREMSDEQFETLVGGVMTAFVNNIVNKSFLQGIEDMFDLLFGSAPGQEGSSRAKGGIRAVTDKASQMLVPAIVRNAAQDIDPVWRETDSFIQAVISQIPFLSDELPAKRDWLGREIVREEGQRGLFQAIRSSSEKDSLLEREVAQLSKLGEFDLSQPSRRFNEQPITREEQSRVLQIQGQDFRMPSTGLNMEEALRALVESEAYATWPDARRGEAMRDTVSRYRRAANVAIRSPRSEHYMAEMVERTGMAKIGKQQEQNGWTDQQARGRARRYGVAPDTFDTIMSNRQAATSGVLNGESPTP